MDIESEEMRKLIVAIEKGKRVSTEDFDLVHRLAELGELLIKELNLPVIPEPKPVGVNPAEFVRGKYSERIYWEQCQAFYKGKSIEGCQEYPFKPGHYHVSHRLGYDHTDIPADTFIEIRWND